MNSDPLTAALKVAQEFAIFDLAQKSAAGIGRTTNIRNVHLNNQVRRVTRLQHLIIEHFRRGVVLDPAFVKNWAAKISGQVLAKSGW
jgi:hypothetical protein